MLIVMGLSMANKSRKIDSIMPVMQMILTDTGRVARVSDESLVFYLCSYVSHFAGSDSKRQDTDWFDWAFSVSGTAKGIFDSLVWLGRTLITFKFAAVGVGVVDCLE